jgi:hypothetical protein
MKFYSPFGKGGIEGDFKKKCFHIFFIKSPLPLFAKEGFFVSMTY